MFNEQENRKSDKACEIFFDGDKEYYKAPLKQPKKRNWLNIGVIIFWIAVLIIGLIILI